MNISTLPTRTNLLANAILNDIEQGKYSVGDLLPPEMELCVNYQVSRHTVREALRKLRELGIISSKQGSGTRVIATVPAQQVLITETSINELIEFQKQSSCKILNVSTGLLDSELQQLYNISSNQLWLKIIILRFQNRLPIMLSTLFIDAKYQSIQTNISAKTSIFELLKETYGVVATELYQDIDAIKFDNEQAKLFNASGYGLRAIRRLHLANGELVSWVVDITSIGKFKYSLHMKLK